MSHAALNRKTKFAGGRPAADYLSFLAKKGSRKKAPPVCRAACLPTARLRTLDRSQIIGAAQLALAVCTKRILLRNSNSARLTPPFFGDYLRQRTGVKGYSQSPSHQNTFLRLLLNSPITIRCI